MMFLQPMFYSRNRNNPVKHVLILVPFFTRLFRIIKKDSIMYLEISIISILNMKKLNNYRGRIRALRFLPLKKNIPF